MTNMNKNLIIFFIFASLLVNFSYANGGCIKVADDALVQLSSSPLVPIVNKEVSYLISFGDKEGLINDEINGKLWITNDDEKILTKNFKIKDGILDLKHIFKNTGLYEIFLEFKIENKTYTPEDFLIEVKEQRQSIMFNVIFLLIGIFSGIILMKLIKK